MKIIIGIPIYKNMLNVFEKVSLQQVDKMLGDYEIVFIAPQSLIFDYGKTYKVERFSDEYFQNGNTYSRLLLLPQFYQRFILYDYLLIYQLDAFVFSDQLLKFCLLGYDYIGAPVKGEGWNTLNCRVGNGGLSLRRISTTIQLLRDKQNILNNKKINEWFYNWEDLFFAYCGARKNINYQVPSVRLAARFSVELDIAHGYRDIAKRGLPFGCHGWYKLNYQYWRTVIEQYGYQLPDCSTVEYTNTLVVDYRRRMDYCLQRELREGRQSLVSALCKIFGKNKIYTIWGAGRDGEKIMNILGNIPMKIDRIYDIHAKGDDRLRGVPITVPEDGMLRKCKSVIIIATKNYEQEIANHLESLNLKRNIDFYFAGDIYSKMYDIYEVWRKGMRE